MSEDRVRKLLAMAVGTANAEESRNAAVMACRAIVKDAQDAAVARGKKAEDWVWLPAAKAAERKADPTPHGRQSSTAWGRATTDWSRYESSRQEPPRQPPKARAPEHREVKLKEDLALPCRLCNYRMLKDTLIAVVKAKSPVHWSCFERTYAV